MYVETRLNLIQRNQPANEMGYKIMEGVGRTDYGVTDEHILGVEGVILPADNIEVYELYEATLLAIEMADEIDEFVKSSLSSGRGISSWVEDGEIRFRVENSRREWIIL